MTDFVVLVIRKTRRRC